MDMNKLTQLQRLFGVLLLLGPMVLLSSCVGNTTMPQDHYYRLPEIESSTIYNVPVLTGVVSVGTVMASGILDERSMLYVEGDKPDEVKYYAYRHWMDSPSKIIRQHLINYFEKTGAAKISHITHEQGGERSGVQIRLLKFERSVTKDDIKAHVSLRISYKAPQQAEILKTYTAAIEAKDSSVYSTVEAFGLGLESIYEEWLADIKED